MPTPTLIAPKPSVKIEKHGTHSTYVGVPEEIPEGEYSIEEWMAKKPEHISEQQWLKLGRSTQGVMVLEEPEDEDELLVTPFGKRRVLTVAERAYLKGGAKKQALGTFDIETGKKKVSRKMSKSQARKLYGHGGYDRDYIYTRQPEAEALAQATGVNR
jgi:hypothetical protein